MLLLLLSCFIFACYGYPRVTRLGWIQILLFFPTPFDLICELSGIFLIPWGSFFLNLSILCNLYHWMSKILKVNLGFELELRESVPRTSSKDATFFLHVPTPTQCSAIRHPIEKMSLRPGISILSVTLPAPFIKRCALSHLIQLCWVLPVCYTLLGPLSHVFCLSVLFSHMTRSSRKKMVRVWCLWRWNERWEREDEWRWMRRVNDDDPGLRTEEIVLVHIQGICVDLMYCCSQRKNGLLSPHDLRALPGLRAVAYRTSKLEGPVESRNPF